MSPAARIIDLAEAMIGSRPIEIERVGIRPGEKLHEVLISEEEAPRTLSRGEHLVIAPVVPELRRAEAEGEPFGGREYSSADDLLEPEAVRSLLSEHELLDAGPAS